MTRNLDNVESDGNSAGVAKPAAARKERDATKQKKQAVRCKNDLPPTSLRYLRNRSFSAEQVRQMIEYSPETGEFFWKPRPLELCNSQEWFQWWNDVMVGKKIVGVRKKKRQCITIKGEKFYAHDVAWAVTHGRWPKRPIIHKNGNVKDNRISNLVESDAERGQ